MIRRGTRRKDEVARCPQRFSEGEREVIAWRIQSRLEHVCPTT
jgi:hypothetical protein